MKKFILATAAILGLLFSAYPATSSFAADAETSGFSGQPATPGGQIDTARSRFTYQVAPGNQVTDQIYVSNTGSAPISLVIYANDAKSLSDGTFDVQTIDQAPKGVASWIKFSSGTNAIEVRLKHDQSMTIPFTMTVPEDAQPGDHAGGIAVSAASSGSGQIQIARRIVTRLYARVQGDISPAMSITDFATKYIPSANPFGGELVMSFTIANDGNVSLSANATTSASTIFGIPVGSQTTSEVEEITPGSFRSYQVSVPSVGQWFYLVPKVTLQPKVDEDAINPGALQEVTRDAAIWQVPYSWLALLAFVLMIFFMIRARIKRRRRQVAEWLEFTDAEAKSKVQG